MISGLLITGHLLREASDTGTIKLARFWGRRIARLLPAAFLVLAVVAVATLLTVRRYHWPAYFEQIRASALYFENWKLAADAVGYWRVTDLATPVRHYWSLSVEEQFYLVWPILLVVALVVTRRLAKNIAPQRVFGAVLVLITVASLAYSINAMAHNHTTAYFSSFTRVWEFAAGGLAAIMIGALPTTLRRSALAGFLAWVGLAMILVAGFGYGDATPFPGFAALGPVIGSVLLVLFGDSSARTSPRWMLQWRPVVWVGGISYAIYLWHWPLLILMSYSSSAKPTLGVKITVLALTLLLAAASTHLFETPLRKSAFFARPRNAIAFAFVGALSFAALTTAANAHLQNELARDDERLTAELGTACFGPAALDPGSDCDDPMGSGDPIPALDLVVTQNYDVAYRECITDASEADLITCHLGADPDTATTKVLLAGNSHMHHWFPTFAAQGAWSVETVTRSACPLSLTRSTIDDLPDVQTSCDTWTQDALEHITASDADVVVLSSMNNRYQWSARPGSEAYADPIDGYAAVLAQLADAGKSVVVIRDVPTFPTSMGGWCLANEIRDAKQCGFSRDETLLPANPAVQAVGLLARPDVRLLDLSDQFCDDEWCYPIVGDIAVFRDSNHLSAQYARALVPWLEPTIDEAAK